MIFLTGTLVYFKRLAGKQYFLTNIVYKESNIRLNYKYDIEFISQWYNDKLLNLSHIQSFIFHKRGNKF